MDGAGCVTILKQILHNSVFTHEGMYENQLDNRLKGETLKSLSYDKLFICGFSIEPDLIKHIDSNKIYIFNNTPNKDIQNLSLKSNIYITESDSVTEVIYRLFLQNTHASLTKEQKLLVRLISDFESYKLTTPFSYALNIIFYGFTGDRIKQFSETFKEGFKKLTPQQQALLFYHDRRVRDVMQNLNPYSATVKLGEKEYTIFSAFCDYGVNEVSKYFFDKLNADISIIINLDKNYASFRASNNCDYDVSRLACNLCNGGGKSKTAGGKLTEKFLTFSKLFKPYEI